MTKSKQPLQYYYWCFTLGVISPNFWEKDVEIVEHKDLKKCLKSLNCKKIVFQMECGKNGYLHFQGFVHLSKKMRITQLKKHVKWNWCHWEKSRSDAAIEYCKKRESRISKPYIYPYEYSGEDIICKNMLYKWQKDVIEMIKGDANKRDIIYIWEPYGNVGKSSLAKYLAYNKKCCYIGGAKESDIFYAVKNFKLRKRPRYIIDIPKSGRNKICYKALEGLKNGMFFSSKFESGQWMGPPGHVVIFSNYEPERGMMSSDRWKIYKIEDGALVGDSR